MGGTHTAKFTIKHERKQCFLKPHRHVFIPPSLFVSSYDQSKQIHEYSLHRVTKHTFSICGHRA